MTLGQKLKWLRSDNRLTQKDLADKLNVTFQTISKWEKDENEPDVATLKKLASIYGCSIDYLVNEDNDELNKKEVEETKTVIIHQRELHVCRRCGKDILENDLAVDHVCVRPSSRISHAEYRDDYYHRGCLNQVNAERKAKADAEQKEKIRKTKMLAFGWGIFGGLAALALMLCITLIGGKNDLHPAVAVVLSFISGYAIFADLYCIITGSYIADVFIAVAGFSIRFPGLIFTWDIEGFIWVIAMKLLFLILGVMLSALTLLLAVILSAGLAMISFPFVLIYNIKTKYKNAI